ncbi:TPA: ATP-binding protein [Pseudomonas aeruginosa]|uniref:sensor histidine kinase n=1 Tax=Pseudomonas aeruginosa TaxID=287 RepID=UPI000FFC4888|nr:HAMP domain-containing sensor histidine kinase [Pseudomonas aeruginosa]EKS3061113.1 HAMP domain-containing histidine kinase [Pseudomonas aeruginosa]MBY9844963.1 HAMP domain-containing histidine kinase [Pseudomonas aeruginosa]QZV16390.1 HAMP domain-containing histidine kinase [Pseudomonas aeruginosa]HCL3499917.1 HAMP domain-containing histidine kinase [Pseudomonas aeruginosa]HEK0048284.1 HAMP domain-containing histidine kinase [Pseudomonas aeruginosa]
MKIENDRFEVSKAVAECRRSGNFEEAMALCIGAIARWSDDVYFRRILADLYFSKGRYKESFLALMDFLGNINSERVLIGQFTKRYYRFRKVLPAEEMRRYAKALLDVLDKVALDFRVSKVVRQLANFDAANPLSQKELDLHAKFVKLLNNDANFSMFVKLEKQIEENSPTHLEPILDAEILNRERHAKVYRIDAYCVSIYEKLGSLDKALKIVKELLAVRSDMTAVRLLFRVCRLMKDYSAVDFLLEEQPGLLRARDFNVLYELVYYFESKDDFHSVQGVLRSMDKGFATNLPVLKTVRNFYIRFGLVDEAKRVEVTISSLYRKQGDGEERYVAEVAESENELASKVQELYSQLEHQKQLAAISDLTTGISHELGQPITNIRYTIQYYRRQFESKLTLSDVSVVFDSILEETERMGGLIRRLAPLTSSRSVIEEIDIMDRIRRRVESEKPRLLENRISVNVYPKSPVYLRADPVKFDQLISNLLINSIDAICERKGVEKRAIEVQVESLKGDLRMYFSDTGIGIPVGNRNKIFDPFFSTKAPGKGEGLGLFIVWNLLKMLGGTISVDIKYRGGARFVVRLPKLAQQLKEVL